MLSFVVRYYDVYCSYGGWLDNTFPQFKQNFNIIQSALSLNERQSKRYEAMNGFCACQPLSVLPMTALHRDEKEAR